MTSRLRPMAPRAYHGGAGSPWRAGSSGTAAAVCYCSAVMPTLSVLLPVRDAGPFLAPALASLWRQTLADFEVIAVDDGSRDGSAEHLERAAAREPRLRVIHTPPRGLP